MILHLLGAILKARSEQMNIFPLIISWFLTIGYVPTMSDGVARNNIVIDPKEIATVAQIGISAETQNGMFGIYTDIENYQYAPNSEKGTLYFEPFRVNYSIGLNIKPVEGILLNIDHQCDHPVTSYRSGFLPYHYNSAITKITVTFSGSSELF